MWGAGGGMTITNAGRHEVTTQHWTGTNIIYTSDLFEVGEEY